MSPHRRLRYLTLNALVFSALSACVTCLAEDSALDQASGFVIDDGWELTNAHCAACHSAKLVTQNRMDRSGWKDTIRLMQAEHGLWDLGAAETVIIDYLTQHYGLAKNTSRARKGRISQSPIQHDTDKKPVAYDKTTDATVPNRTQQ